MNEDCIEPEVTSNLCRYYTKKTTTTTKKKTHNKKM